MRNLSRYRLYKCLSMTAFLLPFIFLLIFFSELFFHQDKAGRLTVFFFIAMTITIVGLKNKIFDTAKKNPSLSISIFLLVTSLIMRSFSTQLLFISLAGIFGSILSAFFEPVVSVYFFATYEVSGDRKKRIVSEEISHKDAWRFAYK